MKKKMYVIVLLISLLLASTTISAVNNQIDLSDDKNVLNEGVADDYLKITEPNIGVLRIFGTSIGVNSLAVIKWGIVVDFTLNVYTNASKTIDYVIFTVTTPSSSVIDNSDVYKINVSSYPFSCSFEDIPTRFNYIINATGYNDSKIVAWDEVYPIAFIKIPLYITP